MTKVKIYSTPTCPYCKIAKEYLKNNKVDFEDIDVSTDHEKAHVMIEKSGQMGVPVIIVEKDGKEEIMVGFDQAALAKIIETNK